MTQVVAVEWSQGVEDAWSAVLTFIPKLLGFLIVLAIGYLAARFLAKLTDTVLERVGFDRAVERGGLRRLLAQSSYDPSDIIAKLVYYAVLLFTLTIAFNIFGPNPISDLLRGVIAFLPKLVVAIVIVVVAAAIAKAVKDIVSNVLGGLSYGDFLANLASVFLLGLGVVAALTQIGIAAFVTSSVLIAVLATLAGILIVGVGGGLVRPMEQRWHEWLDRAAQESQNIRASAQANRGAARQTVSGYTDAPEQAYGPGEEPYGGGYGATSMDRR